VPADRPPTVVLVVLDTVRADHVSACGYGRPTTPTLSSLVAQGAVLSCDAVAPASWTLPSHASFFTGLPPEEHGAHFVPLDAPNLLTSMQVRPLGPEPQTLAETYAARGYQTVLVSGNPVVGSATGLGRGFAQARTAESFAQLRRTRLLDALREELAAGAADHRQPLFLVLNLADAHEPWAPPPPDVGWLDGKAAPESRMSEVFQQQLSEEALAEHVLRMTNSYDYGVFQADQVLGEALALLQQEGWADTGMRLVVVSDHGQFLGEHGLVDHGRYLWEPNQRVFLLQAWLGPHAPTGEPAALPPEIPARYAHDLVLDGHLPATLDLATAAAWPDAYWQQLSAGRVGTSTSAAIWSGDEKLLWQDGQELRFDLHADPQELAPQALAPDHPLKARLDRLAARVEESAGGPVALSPELVQQLIAAGYMQAPGEEAGAAPGAGPPH